MSDHLIFEANLLKGRFIVYDTKPDFDFLKVKQIHSDIIVSETACGSMPEADGIIGKTNTPKVILTADCVPLVLVGKEEHIVIHAGWRGLAQNILGNPLVKKINPYYAFIGPHIRALNYEVQIDFLANFPLNQDAFSHRSGKIYFNLSKIANDQLKSLYPSIAIEDCGICTFGETRFHSYRRDKTSERNWNIYFP
jgi:YfiH family protein